MKIAILGGDGFCGWPTALHLSARGHEIAIIDNFSRRNIDIELGVQSLTPISSLVERLDCWKRKSGSQITFECINVAEDYQSLKSFLWSYRPDAVVHFAEQRSAPYSMKSAENKLYTVNNNLNSTHNLLCAIAETGLDIHLVHLGTMVVYGY